MAIPSGFDFDAISGLSNEVREKLKVACPRSLGQASRLDGVTPAALMLVAARLRGMAPARRSA